MSEGRETTWEEASLDPAALETLSELVGGDREMMRDIVGAFLEDAPGRLTDIADGLANDDAELVRRAAHTLKGNALTFGALDLADSCKRLEGAAKDGELSGAAPIMAEIERTWAATRPVLESLATTVSP